MKTTHTQRANVVVSHAALDRHHGGTKHGVSTTAGPVKKLGYSIAPSAKP